MCLINLSPAAAKLSVLVVGCLRFPLLRQSGGRTFFGLNGDDDDGDEPEGGDVGVVVGGGGDCE